MSKKIYYCAGHGKYTAGKRSPSGIFTEREWFFNNEVVLGFEEQMKKYAGVSLHRTDDRTGERDVLLADRTNKANNGKADIYISFHHNALSGKWGNHTGVETFHHKNSASGKRLAEMVHSAVVKSYGLRDRGLKTDNLHITRETNMPAVLIEGGFMDSNIDIKKLRDKKVLRNAGKNVADAVAKYLNLKKKSNTTTKPKTSTKSEKVTTGTNTKKLYRVRKSWVNQMSQIGAFASLNNAKDLADKNKTKGYKVYDHNGKVVYNPSKKKSQSPSSTKKTNTTTFKVNDKVKIKKSASRYTTGQSIPAKIKNNTYTIRQVKSDRVLLKEIMSWVYKKDINISGKSNKAKSNSTKMKVGNKVKIKKSASKYATGQPIPARIKGRTYTIRQVKSDRVLLKEIMSWVYKKDIE